MYWPCPHTSRGCWCEGACEAAGVRVQQCRWPHVCSLCRTQARCGGRFCAHTTKTYCRVSWACRRTEKTGIPGAKGERHMSYTRQRIQDVCCCPHMASSLHFPRAGRRCDYLSLCLQASVNLSIQTHCDQGTAAPRDPLFLACVHSCAAPCRPTCEGTYPPGMHAPSATNAHSQAGRRKFHDRGPGAVTAAPQVAQGGRVTSVQAASEPSSTTEPET